MALATMFYAGPVFAVWSDFAFVSSTLGISTRHLCYGDASRGDIGCPADAPYVSPTGTVGIGGVGALAGWMADHSLAVVGDIYTANRLVLANGGTIGWGPGAPTVRLRGSSDDGNLQFIVADTEAARIVSSGFVGLGTTDPSSSLHLFAASGNNSMFRVGTASTYLSMNHNHLWSTNSPLSLNINANTNIQLLPGTGSGKVGIRLSGTTVMPSASLHISGTMLNTSWTGINFSSGANVTPTAPLEVSGTISATHFSGDGSGLTGVVASAADRITSGTTLVVANDGSGYVSFSSAGVTTGWYSPAGVFAAVGVSATGQVSASSLFVSDNAGIGTAVSMTGPRLSLGTSGSIAGTAFGNAALYIGNASTGVAFDDNEIALRNQSFFIQLNNNNLYMPTGKVAVGMNAVPSRTVHVSGTLLTTSWTGINFAGSNSVTPTAPLEVFGTVSATRFVGDGAGLTNLLSADRIVSGSTLLVANQDQGVSATGNLDVSGTLRIAGTGTEVCDAAHIGVQRINPSTGRPELCRW